MGVGYHRIENNEREELFKTIRRVEGNLNKLSSRMDVDNYIKQLDLIKNESGYYKSISMIDYSVVSKCLEKINDLNARIDFELIPFYNMILLQDKIKANLDDKEYGIDEAIENCIKLFDLLNLVDHRKVIDYKTGKSVDPLRIDNLNTIYNDSLRIIYSVIIQEQIYGKTTLNDEFEDAKYFLVTFEIVKYLYEDLLDIKSKVVIKNDQNYVSERERVVPLRKEYIDEVVDTKFSNEKKEYLERKERARTDLKKRIFDYQNEVDELRKNEETLKASIKNIKVDRRINKAKLMSYVLVPIILIGSGFGIGVACSNNIDEYKTTTRVVNPVDQKIVETISEVYDEKENTYTATVKVYSPWQKRGDSYIRNVYAYNYDPNKLEYDSFDAKDSKYHYMEAKDKLDSTDSMEEGTVLITETIQDKSDSRKSTKYIIPFSIIGAVLSIVIDILIGMNMGTYDIKVALRKLKRALEEKELVKEELLDDAKSLYQDGSIIRNECSKATNIYKFSDDEFSELKIIKKTWK